jgi:hypothetical protein
MNGATMDAKHDEPAAARCRACGKPLLPVPT